MEEGFTRQSIEITRFFKKQSYVLNYKFLLSSSLILINYY